MSESSTLPLIASGLFLLGLAQFFRAVRNRKATVDQRLEHYRIKITERAKGAAACR